MCPNLTVAPKHGVGGVWEVRVYEGEDVMKGVVNLGLRDLGRIETSPSYPPHTTPQALPHDSEMKVIVEWMS